MWRLYFANKNKRRRSRFRYQDLVESLEVRTLLTSASPDVTDYATYLVLFEDDVVNANAADELDAAHRDFTDSLQSTLGESVSVRFSYTNAINAMAVWLTPSQAEVVAELPTVANVLPDSSFALQQNSATLTGAPQIWNGSAVSTAQGTFGEGVLIGVIDSGIDFDNASFAAVGPVDGYQHTNPFGDGSFLGVCNPNNAGFDASYECNDKVVGAYDFTSDTAINDSNFADHGTSVASIAAGNFVATVVPGTNEATEISGVAPHANLISYDVCDSSDNCISSAILAAVDQAIADGVDVINMSIGGPTENPWAAVMATAMFNAHNAGIFVAVSAGNEGPELASITAPADAPWVTAVASTDNGSITTIDINVVGTNVPPDLATIPALRGENLNVTTELGPAAAVHVANIAPGDHLGSSAYPANSLAGRIALIDRGTSFFETKVRNAWEAGAVGVVMINSVDGPLVTMAGVSQFPIPSVMISKQDGAKLRQWLQNNPTSEVRINAQQVQQLTAVAGFSSRGQNEQADTLVPHIAAPGADNSVIAAVATTGTDQWEYFSGTSAASPHIAGAAALLHALHPNWTPSEIQSALQTTARSAGIVTGSALIEANAFDVGSGLVDIAAAANAGLVLDVTSQQFRNSDPTAEGDPSALNLASFVDSNVVNTTSWTRTIKSTQSTSVTWTPVFESDDGLTLRLNAASITVAAGAQASFTLTAEVAAGLASEWMFGHVRLMADVDLPDAIFPVAVKPTPVAGVTISPSGSGTDTSEAGATDTYEVQLLTAPNGLVQIEVNAPPQLEISSDGETFSSSVRLVINNAFPWKITVRATDDAVAESTHVAVITHSVVETTDANYPVDFGIDDAEVQIFDNDIGQLQLAPSATSLTEGSAFVEAIISRSANSDLTQPLPVTLQSTGELTFASTTGEAISVVDIPAGQSEVVVRISATDNFVIDGNRTQQVTVSSPSFESASQSFDIQDDDVASIKTVETSGATVVTRGSSTDTFTAQLRTVPSGDVLFNVISADAAAVSVNVQRLTFTAENWNTPQTVVVTGIDEGQTGLVEVVVSISVVPELSASEYSSVSPANVQVSLVDAGETAPTILGPKGRTLNDPVTYRWTPVVGADSYDVYVDRVGGSFNPILEETTSDTFYLATEQGIGSYRFWVRANFGSGGSSAWIGQTYQISTAANISELPYFANTARPQITWDDIAGAATYQIYISNRTTGQNGLFNVSGLTSTSFTPDVDLTFGEHRVWVRAIGANNFAADWSAPTDYFVGPTLLGPIASTFDLTPEFRWSAPAGSGMHEIFIRRPDGSSLVQSGLSTSFQPAEELSVGRHVWWVRTSTFDGQRGPWSQPAVTFIGGRTALANIESASNAAPVFEWERVEGAVEYEVFVNRTDVAKHIYSVNVDSTSWQSTILADGDYIAWIRPIDSSGEPGFWSPPSRFTIAAAQTNIATQATSSRFVSFSNTPTLSWEANPAADSYDVFIHDGVTGSLQSGIRITSWTTPDLGEGSAAWWVRTVDSAGNVGPWSSAATIDTTGRTATNPPSVNAAIVEFTWTAVTDSDRYILQVDNLTTGQTMVIREDQLLSPQFTTTTALPSGTYRFWVRAIRNASPSEGFWSSPTDFVVP